jgi:hypothetical protein
LKGLDVFKLADADAVPQDFMADHDNELPPDRDLKTVMTAQTIVKMIIIPRAAIVPVAVAALYQHVYTNIEINPKWFRALISITIP